MRRIADNKMKDSIKQSVYKVNRHAEVWLFGSRARKQARIDSDWDVLVLTNDNTITIKDEEKYIDQLSTLMAETGQVIQVLVYSAKEWNSKYSVMPLYKSIQKEGIKL